MSRRSQAARADAELDRASRELPAFTPSQQQSENTRTSLLALAEAEPDVTAARWRLYAAGGAVAAVAAAIGLLVWTGANQTTPNSSGASLARIEPGPATQFKQLASAPDQVVALTHGHLDIEVAHLDADERFRVRTDDAVIEVRGTRFEVRADNGKLSWVVVEEGRVEVRPDRGAIVLLGPGERWALELARPTKPKNETTPPPTRRPDVERPGTGDPAGSLSRPEPRAPARRARRTTRPKEATPAKPKTKQDPDEAHAKDPSVAPPPRPLSPGEQAFRDGWRALRKGNHGYAAERLSVACRSTAAVRQDACFWVAVAWKRAGRTSHARRAFSRFLHRYPRAPRAGEARAVLGWMLFHSGDLTTAKRLFGKAAHDRVPAVRRSARKGLEAIKRKRHH